MKVAIIGAGNVATHLAKSISAVNIEITQIWSYHYQNAQVLAKTVNAAAIDNLNKVEADTDICLIAIKDDKIATVVGELRNFKGLLVHTSGSVSLNVFKGAIENYGVLYPLQTFSKNKEVDFASIPLCLEANSKASLNKLITLASNLSTNVIEVNSEKRKILHLAAVFACNFTNHLYALAGEILKTNELEFEILRPLIAETAAKVQHSLPLEVQTGPAIRNDNETLKKHEELLTKQPALLEIYKTLSDSIKKTI